MTRLLAYIDALEDRLAFAVLVAFGVVLIAIDEAKARRERR